MNCYPIYVLNTFIVPLHAANYNPGVVQTILRFNPIIRQEKSMRYDSCPPEGLELVCQLESIIDVDMGITKKEVDGYQSTGFCA